jgi:hydroxyproline O-arabinosyltransferase
MIEVPPVDVAAEMEPFYLLHFTYGMDYTRKGVFTPGKYGEWRFDKRTYAQLPPPRHLSEPPRGMKNALVFCRTSERAAVQLPLWRARRFSQHMHVQDEGRHDRC